MELRVLGPLEAVEDGRVVAVGGRQRRRILALLLAHAPEPVSTDRLVDQLWPDRPPAAARRTVQAHVAHLRSSLGADLILAASGGYAMTTPPTDLEEFTGLFEQALAAEAASPAGAALLLRQALDLFRGDPYAGLADDVADLQQEVNRIQQVRWTAFEHWLESELRSGRTELVAGEAERLIVAEPLRERLWELLMLSLYRSGRPADALTAFGRLRRTLIEELGIEPSTRLQQLEQQILEHDPVLGADRVVDSLRLPEGTLTFLFTDLEGSSRLWVERDDAASVLEQHEELLRRQVEMTGGHVFKGMGDGVMAVFVSAEQALAAAVTIQREVKASQPVLAVRIAIHSGEAELHNGDYFGLSLTVCSRVLEVAHGGQILMTSVSRELIGRNSGRQTTDLELGRFTLRGLTEPVRIYQVGHPDMEGDFPPLRARRAGGRSLPRMLTSFVGREREVKRVGELLESSRLVTLVGVGGGGKTRLAIEAVRRVTDPNLEARFVDLAPLLDPDLVPRRVADAYDVAEEPGTDPVAALTARLADEASLLVIDNCEHMVAVVASLAEMLLRSTDGLKILATSRERLGVPGEQIFRVPPLGLPPVGANREESIRFDSVRLFVARALLVQPDFGLTDANNEAIGRICRALDGIPLALELAAGRLANLDLDDIAAHLGLRLLEERSRVGESRHRTLLAALEWSYDLLAPGEKELFARLSVFRGGFDVADVEEVCGSGRGIVDDLVSLHEKSLVIKDNRKHRFSLLEPVREFATDRLQGLGGAGEIARRHARHFARTLAAVDTIQVGATGEMLGRNQDNIRAAIEWALTEGEARLGLELVSAAWQHWKVRGMIGESRSWLERAIALAKDSDPQLLMRAHLGAGDLAAGQGDDETAATHLTRAAELAASVGDESTSAAALTRLAGTIHRQGQPERAAEVLRQALDRARRGGDTTAAGHSLAALALLAEDQGRGEDADAYLREALGLELTDEYLRADILLAAGEVWMERGELDPARPVLEEALSLARTRGFENVTAWANAYLGELCAREGHKEEADRRLSHALARFQRLDSPVGVVWTMRHLGRVALERDQIVRARALLEEAISIARRDITPEVPPLTQLLAEIETAAANHERAALLGGRADRLFTEMGVAPRPRDHQAAAAAADRDREALGHDRYLALVAEGSRLELEELLPTPVPIPRAPGA